ncbi:MAG: acyl-CoA dehydrogenase family protein [Pseudomonadota bacterium]
MDFDFSDDQKEMRAQARRFLEENCPPAKARAVMESDATHDATLWKKIADLGWLGTAVPEAHGGVGLGHEELCVLAEEIGRAIAPVPFNSSVYLATEALLIAGSEAQKAEWLPKLASGALIGTFALAEKAADAGPEGVQASLTGGALSGRKVAVADGVAADIAIVVARTGPGAEDVGLALVDLRAQGVERAPADSIDPSRSFATLTFDGAAAEALGDGAGWSVVEHLLDRAAALTAFEQVGLSDVCLDMAKEYALTRYAFGRPIGSFQAIKHKLADVYVANELARSNAYYGAWALSSGSSELAEAAAGARVSATEAAFLASKENIQTHGGMGYTWEGDCHLYYRRAKALSLQLGAARVWKEKLIRRLERKNAA